MIHGESFPHDDELIVAELVDMNNLPASTVQAIHRGELPELAKDYYRDVLRVDHIGFISRDDLFTSRGETHDNPGPHIPRCSMGFPQPQWVRYEGMGSVRDRENSVKNEQNLGDIGHNRYRTFTDEERIQWQCPPVFDPNVRAGDPERGYLNFFRDSKTSEHLKAIIDKVLAQQDDLSEADVSEPKVKCVDERTQGGLPGTDSYTGPYGDEGKGSWFTVGSPSSYARDAQRLIRGEASDFLRDKPIIYPETRTSPITGSGGLFRDIILDPITLLTHPAGYSKEEWLQQLNDDPKPTILIYDRHEPLNLDDSAEDQPDN